MTLLYALFVFLQVFIPSRTYAITGNPVKIVSLPPKSTQEATLSGLPSMSSLAVFVQNQAILRGINPNLADCIVFHESQWTNRDGDDGQSRGLWQISKIFHPEVTDACAYDYSCATKWSLNWIAQGHVEQWSTYHLYCGSLKIFQ